MTKQNDQVAQALALAAQSLAEAQAARAHATELTAHFGSLMLNEVLEVGTGVIEATGAFSRDFRAPYAAVSVVAPISQIAAFGSAVAAGPDLTVSLPAGATLLGYDYTTQPPGSAVGSQVNLAGVQGGPTTAFYRITTAGGQWFERFPDGLPAIDANTAPSVTIPSIATGPALFLSVYGRAGRLVVTNSPRQGSPPGSGVGLFDVPSGCAMTRRMVGSTLTVYGTPGQRFSYTVFARPQPESFGRLT